MIVAWIAATVITVNGFYILAPSRWSRTAPTFVSTWTRVYFDRREWKRQPDWLIGGMHDRDRGRRRLLEHVPRITGTRILNGAILYWATWHFVAQNWGILRIYQRKSGEPSPRSRCASRGRC